MIFEGSQAGPATVGNAFCLPRSNTFPGCTVHVCAGAVAVACDVAGGSPGAMEGIRDRLAGVRLKDGRLDRYGIC